MVVSNNSVTKVYYHIIDDSTPYMSVVHVPPERITLRDFHKVFKKRGYSYFYKKYDSALEREVKVEITDDSRPLHRTSNGLIELFLLPCEVQGTSSLNQRNRGVVYPDNKEGSLKNINRTERSASTGLSFSTEDDVHGGQRVSMITNERPASDINTLISRRAGEQLADIEASTSEDLYCSNYSNKYLVTSENFSEYLSAENNSSWKRRPRKHHRRKPYVPSTISSVSESSYSFPCIEEIKLKLQDGASLGLSIASQDGAIFVASVENESASYRSGLSVGDQIVQIENTRFEQISEDQALDILKRLTFLKKAVTLYVVKRARLSNGPSDAQSLLCETMQLDVSEWVESTKKVDVDMIKPFADVPTTDSSSNPKSIPIKSSLKPSKLNGDKNAVNLSDRKDCTIIQTTNSNNCNMGPKSGLKKLPLPHLLNIRNVDGKDGNILNPAEIEMQVFKCHPRRDSPKVTDQSSTSTDFEILDPFILLKRMVLSDSGVDIRDRRWLKIPIPMSFIGREMVDWLLRNVNEFKSRRSAFKYASFLLRRGYIRHIINVKDFNEKCYYVFACSIIDPTISQRILIEQHGEQNACNVLEDRNMVTSSAINNPPTNILVPRGDGVALENSTEITYMSSPTSTFRPSQNHMNGIVVVNNSNYVSASNKCSMVRTERPVNCSLMKSGTQWPISPILPPLSNPKSPSPTHDYESIVVGKENWKRIDRMDYGISKLK